MSDPDRDQSIENEPHLRPGYRAPDESEEKADRLFASKYRQPTEFDAVEHTVWEEPTLSAEVSGPPPEGQVTYARWLDQKIAETSSLKSWLVTLVVVLVAGPWGVWGAITNQAGSGAAGLLLVAVVAPVSEEIMKIAAALWVVEKRPYLFRSIPQILICAAAGGLVFAYIENLLYLHVYARDLAKTSPNFVMWRWTVCVGLHVNCSFVAGIGLVRIWDNAIRERRRPQLGLGMPWFFIAMVGHGLYNAGVSVAEASGWLKF